MANNGWMNKHPLGSLASTTNDVNYLNHPKEEKITNLSNERKNLLEEYRSNIITTAEFKAALSLIRIRENKINEQLQKSK